MAVTIDGSAGVTTNAGGSVNPSTTIDGINYSCRAWVNFNGTGTVAIRASGNVSSITDSGSGQYAVNFTTAMPDVNYVSVFSSNANADAYGGARQFSMIRTRATGSIQVNTVDEGGVQSDPSYVGGAIFR